MEQRSALQPNATHGDTTERGGDEGASTAAAPPQNVLGEAAERRVRRRIWNKRTATEEEERSWGRRGNGEGDDQAEEGGALPRGEDGKPGGGDGASARRKRLVGKQKPSHGLRQVTGVVRERDKRWDRGHHLHRRGQVVFCTRCGCFAIKRMGTGLRTQCKPPATGASAAIRVSRLLQGLHPVTTNRMQVRVGRLCVARAPFLASVIES